MSVSQEGKPQGIFAPEEPFFVGCNYWAGHAGTAMWRHWDAAQVESDFKRLSAGGIGVLRVFPLWPDFQPLRRHTGYGQGFVEMRFGENPLPDTPAGRAGVDPVMVERFRTLAELAAQYGLKLIVGLVTGWMSGRMHVPEAFDGGNVITDPTAVKWQVRMVRFLVHELRSCAAIVAWDLGNECNCMADVSANPDAAWTWSMAITAAIKLEDRTRPVVSGMHSLVCEPRGNAWGILDQAEVTDVLTTHPYPLFTPHCNYEPINTMRNAFHAVAETLLYGDVGHVPAFVEEAGSLGPSQSSDARAGKYMNNLLWNGFAHNCRGVLWWCAFDQDRLEQPPYDWVGIERELGLIRSDGGAKPAFEAMGAFARLLDEYRLRRLPRFRRDAVLLLSSDQDCWAAAFSGFILAKQAGFDVELHKADQTLVPSKFYLLPSASGHRVLPRHCWLALLDAVKHGATLLVTGNDAALQPFNSLFGVEIDYRIRNSAPVRLKGEDFDLECTPPYRTRLICRTAEVLATDADGSPVFTAQSYGKGKLLFIAVPVELLLADAPGAFLPGAQPFHKLYQIAARHAGVMRRVTRTNPALTLTEHPVDADHFLVIAVNNTPDEIADALTPAADWAFDRVVTGGVMEWGVLKVAGNSGAVLAYRRNR